MEHYQVKGSKRGMIVHSLSDGRFDYRETGPQGQSVGGGYNVSRETIDALLDGLRIDFPSLRRVDAEAVAFDKYEGRRFTAQGGGSADTFKRID